MMDAAIHVCHLYSRRYVLDDYFDVDDVLSTSSAATPICFFISPGTDPLHKIEQKAAEYNLSTENGSYVAISMGQGQEVKMT